MVANELAAARATLRKARLANKASKRKLLESISSLKHAQADFDATFAASELAEHEVCVWRELLIENNICMIMFSSLLNEADC